MTNQDRSEFAKSLYILGDTFNVAMPDLMADGYFAALQDLTLAQAKQAMAMALQTCKFFPRPVELREILQGDPESNADAGWAEVTREIRRVGYMGQPNFTDARVLAAVNDIWGSWTRLCETLPGDGPELVGWIKQFKSNYRSQGVRARTEALSSGMTPELKEAIGQIANAKRMPGLRLVENDKGGAE